MADYNYTLWASAALGLPVLYALKALVLDRRWAQNIPGPAATSLLTGNLLDMIAPTTGREWQLRALAAHGSGLAKVQGLLRAPALLVADPLALHHMLVKAPDVFDEWPAFAATNGLLFGDGLVAVVGAQHKKQRRMLNPVFAQKHLRGMAPTFFAVARQLGEALAARVADAGADGAEVDMTGWLTRTALELIGQSGMGHSFGDLRSNEENAFAAAAKDLAATVSVLVPLAPFTPYFKHMGPAWLRRLVVRAVPWALLQRLRAIVDIMTDSAVQIYQAKKREAEADKAAGVGGEARHDIMGILLKANASSSPTDRLSDAELVGQMSTLIFTATDTTSGAMARALDLLAAHPAAQARLATEVRAAFEQAGGAELDFDTVSGLPYLDAVVKETLRVYPTIPMVFRKTTAPAVIPLHHPLPAASPGGAPITSVPVPAGTDIFISILGNNHSPATWGADAGEWRPERWLAPLPDSVDAVKQWSGVYSHMMTFIAGGRACIGFRFSQLEMKVVLASLLRDFAFAPAPGKPVDWHMGLLMTPVVRGQKGIEGRMPLLVRRRD